MTTIDALEVPPVANKGLMIIPKWDEGDTRVEWDSTKDVEVEAARRQFVDLKAKGYKAYRVDPKSGDKGEIIKEFDPKAQKIVMLPAFAGG